MLVDTYGIETALHQTENDEQLKRRLAGQVEAIRKLIEGLKEREEKN